MTASKKLFLAAVLLAAGYGVAAFLGTPAPGSRTEALRASVSPRDPAAAESAAVGPSMVGSVRLLPEPIAAQSEPIVEVESDSSGAQKSEAPSSTVASTAFFAADAPSARPGSPLLTERPAPRAMLKNEAPRPLPETGLPPPPNLETYVDRTAYEAYAQSALKQAIATDNVLAASFRSDASPPPQNVSSPQAAIIATSPWLTEEDESVRSHVIVDGDSLAKLAGRYLDDPRRSDEIFALNRSVLSDPDLLPIGAELKIPARAFSGVTAGRSRNSPSLGTSSVHAAEHTGRMPLRPPPMAPVTPRAQLLPPRPVD